MVHKCPTTKDDGDSCRFLLSGKQTAFIKAKTLSRMSTKNGKAVYHGPMEQHTPHNQPVAMVIFGGTGNLAETKLLPSLFNLYVEKLLPDNFVIVGMSRKDLSDDEYRTYVRDSVRSKSNEGKEEDLDAFCAHVRYTSGSFDDGASYDKIKAALSDFDQSIGQCTSKLFYLAVPPTLYAAIFEKLKESNAMALCDGVYSWSRLLVEKPFGNDLKTAEELERQLCELFTEDQIYRIDHYLAKDSIENIISLRFANSILADSWNGDKIESIEEKFEDIYERLEEIEEKLEEA